MKVGGLVWFYSRFHSERSPGHYLGCCQRCWANRWTSVRLDHMVPTGNDFVDRQPRCHRAELSNRLRQGQVSHGILFLQLPHSFCGTVKRKSLIFMLLFMFTSTWIYSAVFFSKLSLYLWKYALWELRIDISAVTFLKDVFKRGHSVVGVSLNTLRRF